VLTDTLFVLTSGTREFTLGKLELTQNLLQAKGTNSAMFGFKIHVFLMTNMKSLKSIFAVASH